MSISDKEKTSLLSIRTTNGRTSPNVDSECLELTGSFSNRRKYQKWSPTEHSVTLAWSNLSVYVKVRLNGKYGHQMIINSVSGAVKSGSLVALMGASGAGKSTLMSSLAYRNTSDVITEGNILVNGRPIGNSMKHLSGFMYQDDLFVGSLTVKEHMTVMANLKLDKRISKVEKDKRINSILKQLGLLKCLNTRIGGIGKDKSLSGGEKKRLSFATELLTDPPVLFCDEPTTGLDSYSAQKLVRIMSMLTATGKTIICTIHQPSSEIYAMFSQLILLADGKVAFMGSTANATIFFERLGYRCPISYNPADFFIKVLADNPTQGESSKHAIKKICNHYAVSEYAKEIDTVIEYEFHMGRAAPTTYDARKNFKEISWWQKMYWLTYRWFLDANRNPSIQVFRLLQRMIIALIVGMCYSNTIEHSQDGIQALQGVIFMFVTENTFFPMYSVLAEFPEKIPLFFREFRSGLYHPATYYTSRILSLLPGFLLEPALFVVIAYWLAGLRATTYTFLMTALAAILTSNVSSSCGIMFSTVFQSVPAAMAYLIPFDQALMVTSGIFLKLSTLPNIVSWIKYCSWLMYSMESISILQFSGITNITCDIQSSGTPCVTNGIQVLEQYSFSEENLSRDLWNMFVIMVVFYLVGYFCLWRRTRRI